MPDDKLEDIGVLVTRPQPQSRELVAAVEKLGGRPIAFPVIEIHPRHPDDIASDAHRLATPDIAIFVSRNAVAYGLEYAESAAICAIGPATAAALEGAGRSVTIRSHDGFDSEHLLADSALANVDGQTIRIIRGHKGRELLATTLRSRGAKVEYLAVYERRKPDYDVAALAAIEAQFDAGEIDVVTVMSVESLDNLLDLLPAPCIKKLRDLPLVTPAARVLKEALERIPGSRAILADGPRTGDMVRAIVALSESGKTHDQY